MIETANIIIEDDANWNNAIWGGAIWDEVMSDFFPNARSDKELEDELDSWNFD